VVDDDESLVAAEAASKATPATWPRLLMLTASECENPAAGQLAQAPRHRPHRGSVPARRARDLPASLIAAGIIGTSTTR